MADRLISLQQAKLYCKIPNENDRRDKELTSVVDGVTADIQESLNRELFTDTHTDYFNPEFYQTRIRLRQYPIQSVAGVCDSDALLTEGTHYEIDMNTGVIDRIDGLYFTRGAKKIVATYSAGYDEADIPFGIQSAAKQLTYDLFYDRNAGSVVAIKGVRKAWLVDGFPPNVASRLRPFERPPVV